MDWIAAALRRDGVCAGDAVAICAKTSINYAALGILAAGAAVTPRISPDRGWGRTKVLVARADCVWSLP